MSYDFLEPLYRFDPALAESVQGKLDAAGARPTPEAGERLVQETLWGLAQELSLGQTLAEGYAALLRNPEPRILDAYQGLTRRAAEESGPTYAKIMARTLVPVLLEGDDDLLNRFLGVVRVIRSKGDYALVSPLEAFVSMLESGHPAAGRTFLAVLESAFSQSMSYNRCKQLAGLLGQAWEGFPDTKKTWMLSELNRIIRLDVKLAEPFILSLQRELGWLDQTGLASFVTTAIRKYRRNQALGEKFVSLSSQVALDACMALQRVVPLQQIRSRLSRYLQASAGFPLRIRPVSSRSGAGRTGGDEPTAFSDGRCVYLPEEIGIGDRETNVNLYKVLTRLEAGYVEFHTFRFDVQKWADTLPAARCGDPGVNRNRIDQMLSAGFSDLECFFSLFPEPQLASDLFAVFEQGRIWGCLQRKSPGAARRARPFLQQSLRAILKNGSHMERLLLQTYEKICLGASPADGHADAGLIRELERRFFSAMRKDETVEAVALLVSAVYYLVESYRRKTGPDGYAGIRLPFDRRIRHDLAAQAFSEQRRSESRIQSVFTANGIRVYRADIRKRMAMPDRKLHPEDIGGLIRDSGQTESCTEEQVQSIVCSLQAQALADAGNAAADPAHMTADGSCRTFRYPEWDMDQGDYLREHVLVRDMRIPEQSGQFYQEALSCHRGLIKRIRYSFELLKPERLTILRRWIEGDEFDYRSLLDFSIEKKAGIMPSERIYTKRIKQTRDVSVLVLVDLSRSTANRVPGTDKSVLQIEKEAIVLLCEALSVVGDAFSVAGFSGTGRLGVDYYRIKEFHESINESVIRRINAMRPLRSTRLGAAIRHAADILGAVESKVRLLLILSDGFPNDNGYKQAYAIEDTRKALLEARSNNLFAHSITVNMSGGPQLDQLYGKLHHNVISDVCELPDQLLQIYGNLTRS